MSQEHFDLVVAGGMTGGHFFCGLALAEKYLEKHPTGKVLFVGVKQGIEGRTPLPDKRMKKLFIRASGFKRQNIFQKFESLLFLIEGCVGLMIKLWQIKPRYVIGVGGFSSAACVLAAYLIRPFRGFQLAVVDQNSVPGMVNRLFQRLGVPAFSPFPAPGFKEIELPVRHSIEKKAEEIRAPSWPPKKVMVMGGSQGAQGLNQAWISVLPQLKQSFPEMEYIHQTGPLGLDYVKAAYQDLKIPAKCYEFSSEIHEDLMEADLVISRAGALSVLEIIALQRPAVFVPFPQAADDHQRKNAQAVQHFEWIISQNQLNWANLEKVFRSEKPRLPAFRGAAKMLSWRSLFSSKK